MARICLDTDIILEYLKGEPTAIKKIGYYLENEQLSTTAVNAFELLSKIKKERHPRLLAFLGTIDMLEFDKTAAITAANIFKSRKGKKKLGTREILIAAICLSTDSYLLTSDRSKYQGISGLVLV